MSQDPPPILQQGVVYPQEVPRYKLLGQIGAGSFSEIWVARDLESKIPFYVAVKCCHASADKNPSAEVRIMRKLRHSIAQNNHPGASHVVSLLDDFIVPVRSGHIVYHQCLVTELLVGLNEREFEYMCKGPLLAQVMKAHHFLHNHGVAHGDPHIGNMGAVIGSLRSITEEEIVTLLCEKNYSWPTALAILQDDLCPESPHHMKIKIFDFGRAFSFQSGDSQSRPDRDLHGWNPDCNRAPESELFKMSIRKAGVAWSPACEVWALGSMFFQFVQNQLPFPPYVSWQTNEYQMVLRCVAGGPPPSSWTKHLNTGSGLLQYLKETDPSRLPRNTKEADADLQWVQNEISYQSEKWWASVLPDPKLVTDRFPFKEFLNMVQGMTITNASKRMTLDDVAKHTFWRQFSSSQCLADLP